MNDFDFIDIFDNEEREQELPSEPSNTYRGRRTDDFEDAFSGSQQGRRSSERIRIDDFRQSRGTAPRTRQTTPRTERKAEAPVRTPEPEPKKPHNIADEKIVWAGALFVFFGVFVFLIGYWLGKTTMKDVRNTNNQYLSEVEQTLGESRMNANFATGQTTGQTDTVLGDVPHTTPAPEPVGTVSEPVLAPPVITTTTTVARQQATPAPVTTTTVRRTTTTTVRPSQTADANGNYTIQVSAHTSVEKARVVEDQLRSQGYNSYIVESIVNGTRYFRVRVGSFTSKSEAQDALTKLKATTEGRDAYLISLD